MRRYFEAALTFFVLCGFYLFLAGDVSAVEIVAMVVCAALGAGLASGLSVVARERFVLRPPPRAVWNPLAALLPDMLSVGRMLASVALRGGGSHEGGFVRQPYRFGDGTPREAGRRAINLIGISLAPRSFVVRGEEPQGTVLLHGFPPKPVSPDASWPA